MRVVIMQLSLTGDWGPRKEYNVQSFGLAEALVQKGCEVTILTSNLMLRNEDKSIPWTHRRVEDDRTFKVIYLPTLGIWMKQPIVPGIPLEIARLKPDIVQTGEDAYLVSIYGVLYCYLAHIPVVSLQGIYRLARRKTKLHKLHCKTLGQIMYKCSTRMMAKTTAAKKYLMEAGQVPSEKVDVVHIGTNCSRYPREDGSELIKQLGLPHGRMLLSVGRLVAEKEQADLIFAMPDILKSVPDCYLALVGRGPCEQKLRDMAQNIGVGDKVYFITEKIPNKEMNKLYSSAFVYLIPSSYEIFNMTMLESLSVGTPIIARREGGMADVITHGEVGYLYDGDKASDISGYVIAMASGSVGYERMREASWTHARTYDWINVADGFMKSYKAAISSLRGN